MNTIINLFSILSSEDSRAIFAFIEKHACDKTLTFDSLISDLLSLIIRTDDIATFDIVTKYPVDLSQVTRNKIYY